MRSEACKTYSTWQRGAEPTIHSDHQKCTGERSASITRKFLGNSSLKPRLLVKQAVTEPDLFITVRIMMSQLNKGQMVTQPPEEKCHNYFNGQRVQMVNQKGFSHRR